jgi:proteasome lid subunit RPN8/RPN11
VNTFSLFVCSMLCFMVAPAFAADTASLPRTLVEGSPAFDSVTDAVLAVYDSVTQPFPRAEVGGAIVQKDGKFFFTTPVTTDQTKALGFRLALHEGETLVAWYHTHPADPLWGWYARDELEFFSKGDVEVAKKLGVPAYVAIEPTRNVRVFDPSLDKRRMTSTGRAEGRQVATLPIAVSAGN